MFRLLSPLTRQIRFGEYETSFRLVLSMLLCFEAYAGLPEDLQSCDIRRINEEIRVRPYEVISDFLVFGFEKSQLASDVKQVARDLEIADAVFGKPEYLKELGIEIVSLARASSVLDGWRQTSPLASLMAENKATGFLSYVSYAMLVSHGEVGMLAEGDEHDPSFHLPSLKDERNLHNLRRRSRISLRHFREILSLYERREVVVTLIPMENKQRFDLKFEPDIPELSEVLRFAQNLYDIVRFITWEHLPSVFEGARGRYRLRQWGGMGHNLTARLKKTFELGNPKSIRIPWLLDPLLSEETFFFPEKELLWVEFLTKNPPSWEKYLGVLEELEISGGADLKVYMSYMKSTLEQRLYRLHSSPIAWEIWILDEVAQIIGESKTGLALLFDYELRQELASAALDVYEEFVGFHIAILREMK